MNRLAVEKAIARYEDFLRLDLQPESRRRVERLLAEEQAELSKLRTAARADDR